MMKARKAGVAIGGWDWEEGLDWGLEMGSVGGEDMVARGSPIAAREPTEREETRGQWR